MADPKKNPDAADEPNDAAEAATEAADEMIEVQGPDVETSIDDADRELLDQSADDLAAERLADLQRLQAEYVNYRKRVERDREANRIQTVADVVASLLPVLDDLDRAEAHGDLEEGSPFALIAQKLRATLERTGLERVGAKDDEFDPNLHEAIAQMPSDVEVMTVLDVHLVGYRIGEKLVRAAQVAVAVPNEQ